MDTFDIWEGEYTYRCILTNDYKSSARDIVEFYNLRGGKERIFDDMNGLAGIDCQNRSWHRILYSCYDSSHQKLLQSYYAEIENP